MKKYIYTFLFLFISLNVAAIPEITKVEIFHATCPLNGEIEITVSNTIGQVQYELERINAPEGEFNFTLGPHTLNYFTALPPGEYIIKVYDASTGSVPVVSSGHIVEKQYDSEFSMRTPTTSTTTGGNRFCEDNGTLTAIGTGGTRPYTAKIVNTITNQVFEQTGSASATSIIFNKLPAGEYTVEMWDQCGTGALYDGTVTVRSDGTEFQNIKLTSIAKAAIREFNFYATDCSVIYPRAYYYTFEIDGLNVNTNSIVEDIQNTYYPRLEFCMEYEGVMGTWRSMGTSSYINFTGQINNYDPTIDQSFRIYVRNPCRPEDEPVVTEFFPIPKAEKVFSIATTSGYRPGPIYTDFCTIPEVGGFRISLSATSSGFTSYYCQDNYEIHVSGNQNGFNSIYNWTNTANATSFDITGIPLGDIYTVIVKDKSGNILSELSVNLSSIPDKPLSLRATGIIHYVYGYNYSSNCDFDTHRLYTYRGASYYDGFVSSTYYFGMNITQSLTFTIVKAPEGITREPITLASAGYLWTDLPAGDYEIEVDYGCRKDTISRTITQTVIGFDASDEEIEISTSELCDNNKVSVLGYFIKPDGTPYTDSNSYYYYYARAFNSNGVIAGTSPYTRSNAMATISGLSAGTYTIKFYGYYNSGSNPCYYSKELTVEVPEYVSPNVDIVNSGGISCVAGGKADLTVNAAGSNTPFRYRYKEKNANDNNYSAWQQENVFPDLNPGQYTVQIWNTCYAYITQDLTVYDYGQQFVGLIGYVGNEEDGAVCEGKPVTITVLSIGPVVSYQWYKDDKELVGETGPEYLIASASDEHIGKYTVKINNGKCDLTSSVYILSVIPPAETPTLTATGDCVYNGNAITLTVNTTVNDATFQWYRNNEILNGVSNSTYTATQAGIYTVTVTPPNACPSDESNPIVISLPEMYWDNTRQSNNWNDPKNWLQPDGTAANTIPCDETAVIII